MHQLSSSRRVLAKNLNYQYRDLDLNCMGSCYNAACKLSGFNSSDDAYKGADLAGETVFIAPSIGTRCSCHSPTHFLR